MCSSEVSAVSMTATFPRSWAQQLGFPCDHARIHADFSALLGDSRWHHWSPPVWKPESVFSEARGHAERSGNLFSQSREGMRANARLTWKSQPSFTPVWQFVVTKTSVSWASPSMIQYHSARRRVPRSNASCGSSVLNIKWSRKRMCGWSSPHPRNFWGVCYGSSLNQFWVPY